MAETNEKKSKKKDSALGDDAALQATMQKLETKYGVGTIIYGKNVSEELEVVPTGSLGLDIATNIGGYPVGKLIEIFGPESSGKSTMTLHAIAKFQKVGGKCALVDYEQSFDRVYATALGVDVDALIIVQPENQEDGYNIMEELIRTGKFRLVVIDSHTAALCKKRIEGEVGETVMAVEARNNSTALGKIKPLLRSNRCTVIGVSQLRADIGGYGDPNKPTGGNAWKFYTDMRLKVAKEIQKDKESNKTTITIIKNKCARPFGIAIFNIQWGIGVDRTQEILDFAVSFKILEKGGGGWYTLGEGNKLQGDDKVKEFLADNPEYALHLEKEVLTKMAE